MSEASILTLAFVKELDTPRPDGGRRAFWVPDCAGLDPVTASDLGIELALEGVQHMRAEDFVPLLGWVVADMPPLATADDPGKGVALGFLSTFARLAMAAATPERLAAEEARLADWRALWRQLRAEEAKGRRARERRRARHAARKAEGGNAA